MNNGSEALKLPFFIVKPSKFLDPQVLDRMIEYKKCFDNVVITSIGGLWLEKT